MSSTQDKKIVLITGGNNGIGFDTALKIATSSPSHHVIIGSRNLSKGEAALSKINAQAPKSSISVLQLDVTSDASIQAATESLSKDFGRLDILINNAGICPETAEQAWPARAQLRDIFETNVFGPTLLSTSLLPLLRASASPKIVNVTSVLGSISTCLNPEDPVSRAPYAGYRMSKAALNMLTAYQYGTLRDVGVMVWSFCPGFVVTDLGRDREERIKNGIESSETSAQGIWEILQGERDAEVGTFIERRGKSRAW